MTDFLALPPLISACRKTPGGSGAAAPGGFDRIWRHARQIRKKPCVARVSLHSSTPLICSLALALPIIFFHGSLSAGHSRHPGCSFSLARAAWANFSASCSSSSLRVSSTLPHTSSLSCPLITSSFRCTIFSDIVFEWCVATSFYQCSVNHVSFCFANLPLLYFNFQPISIYFILNGK